MRAAGRRSPQNMQLMRLESEMAVSRQNTTEFTEGDDDEGEGEHTVGMRHAPRCAHVPLQFAI